MDITSGSVYVTTLAPHQETCI